MMPTLLAMPPPGYLPVLLTGLVVMIAAVAWFIGRRERSRRYSLAILALVGGPILGCGLALATDWFDPVSPLDYRYHLTVFLGIGTLAGLIVALFFGLSAWLIRVETSKPAPDRVDDLF